MSLRVISSLWKRAVGERLSNGQFTSKVYLMSSYLVLILGRFRYGDRSTEDFAVRRPVVSDAHGHLKIELNPITLKLYNVVVSSSTSAHLPSDGKPFRLSFASNTQLSELHRAVRKAFNLDGESFKAFRTRLWQVQVNPDQLAQAQAQTLENDMIDPALEGPESNSSAQTATRQMPSHLVSALSGKYLNHYTSETDGKDPMLSDIDIEDADCVALEIALETATGWQWPIVLNAAGMAEEVPEIQTAAQPVAPAPLFSQPALFSGESSKASSSSSGVKKQEAAVEKKRQPRGLKGLTNLGVSVQSPQEHNCRADSCSTLEHVLHEQRATVLVKHEGVERIFPA